MIAGTSKQMGLSGMRGVIVALVSGGALSVLRVEPTPAEMRDNVAYGSGLYQTARHQTDASARLRRPDRERTMTDDLRCELLQRLAGAVFDLGVLRGWEGRRVNHLSDVLREVEPR